MIKINHAVSFTVHYCTDCEISVYIYVTNGSDGSATVCGLINHGFSVINVSFITVLADEVVNIF